LLIETFCTTGINQQSAIFAAGNSRSLHYAVAGAPASVGMTSAGKMSPKREKGDLWLEIAFLQ
jgi:hypothetical protein